MGTVRSANESITLHRARYVFHFDHWWNPATAYQAEGRVWRAGQGGQVVVYSYWMRDTIEERIYQLLEEKGLLIDQVVESLSEHVIKNVVTSDELLERLVDIRNEPGEAPRTEPFVAGRTQSLDDVTPHQLEQLVGQLFTAMGYTSTVTGACHTGSRLLQGPR